MNPQAIDHALDADLRLSQQALQRAARRARELAQQTGTLIVVFRNGAVEHLQPENMARTVPDPSGSVGSDQQ